MCNSETRSTYSTPLRPLSAYIKSQLVWLAYQTNMANVPGPGIPPSGLSSMLTLCPTPTQVTSMPWMTMHPKWLTLRLIKRQKQSAPNIKGKPKNGPGSSKTLMQTYSCSLDGGPSRRALTLSPTSCRPCECPVNPYIDHHLRLHRLEKR